MITWLVMSEPGKTKFDIAVVDKVREMRLQKGLSQTAIADALNLSRGFIGQIESHTHASKYSLNQLNRLAKEMNCSPKDFLPDSFIEESEWD